MIKFTLTQKFLFRSPLFFLSKESDFVCIPLAGGRQQTTGFFSFVDVDPSKTLAWSFALLMLSFASQFVVYRSGILARRLFGRPVPVCSRKLYFMSFRIFRTGVLLAFLFVT